MRSTLSKCYNAARVLVLALLLAALAQPAISGSIIFDDPLVTPGVDDNLLLDVVTGSTTQLSKSFTIPNSRDRIGFFKVVISACSTCNITFQLEVRDPDGTVWTWDTKVALTATGTTRYVYGCRLMTATPLYDCFASDMTGPPIFIGKPIPGDFKVRMVWNSGTSASYTVQGVAW